MTPKPWYFSKSILGSLVAALVYIAGLFGLHLADLAPQILDGISKQIDATMTIAGIVFAIYGRVVATKAIKSGCRSPTRVRRSLSRRKRSWDEARNCVITLDCKASGIEPASPPPRRRASI